jgi:hypothetical protein
MPFPPGADAARSCALSTGGVAGLAMLAATAGWWGFNRPISKFLFSQRPPLGMPPVAGVGWQALIGIAPAVLLPRTRVTLATRT